MDIENLKPNTVINKNVTANDVTLFYNGTSSDSYKCTIGYIHNGYAYVSTRIPNTLIDWTSNSPICAALDIAVAYDGSWLRDIERKYVLVNQGECIVAIVDSTGSLRIYYDESYVEYLVIDTCVSKVSIVRGWKNTIDDTKDQGIVVAYIKNDTCYYCSIRLENGVYSIWQEPTHMPIFNAGIVDIKATITNDFRVLLVGVYTDKIIMAFSNRTWAGISGPQEVVMSNINKVESTTERLFSATYSSEKDSSSASVGMISADTDNNIVTNILGAKTLDNTTLEVEFNTKLHFTSLAAFLSDVTISYTSIHTGKLVYSYAKSIISQHRRCVIFDITHIGNALGDIHISYNGTSVLTGYGEVVTHMSYTFTGSNLIPDVVDPPILISAINVGGV